MNLVKLGGSVLTDKRTYRTLRGDVLRRLAHEVHEGGVGFVVHGAGSFGHVLAARHDLASGATSQDQLLAAARVQADVRDLHARVLAALVDAGVPAFSALPAGHLDDAGRVDAADLLRGTPRGGVPVSGGDVVAHPQAGVAIVSGDDVLVAVGRHLVAEGRGPVRVVFAMGEDGVLDEDGAVMPTFGRGATVTGDAEGADVTGGIVKKVEAGLDLAEAGCDVLLVNGLVAGRIAAALRGDDVVGTRILP